MFGLHAPEFFVILVGIPIYLAVMVLPLSVICKKAGYSAALGFLGLIPVANICLMFYLAFAEWPITKELMEHRRRS